MAEIMKKLLISIRGAMHLHGPRNGASIYLETCCKQDAARRGKAKK